MRERGGSREQDGVEVEAEGEVEQGEDQHDVHGVADPDNDTDHIRERHSQVGVEVGQDVVARPLPEQKVAERCSAEVNRPTQKHRPPHHVLHLLVGRSGQLIRNGMHCNQKSNQHQPTGVSTCTDSPQMPRNDFKEDQRGYFHTVVMADVGSDHNRNDSEELPERSLVVHIRRKPRPRDFASHELPHGHSSDDDHEHHRQCDRQRRRPFQGVCNSDTKKSLNKWTQHIPLR
jgi:hypothetical protein